MQSGSLFYKRTMDSFHIYLPSNACYHISPDNTASDYETQLNQRIDLNGEWEVGVKSLVYSSYIEEKHEKMQVICEVETHEKLLRNNYVPFKFKLNEHGKWKGLDGVTPSQFAENPRYNPGVINTLNNMNGLIFEGKKPVFSFSKSRFSTAIAKGTLFLKLTTRLRQVLGFPSNVLHSEHDLPTFVNLRRTGREKLTANDYLVKYFSPEVQHLEKRIVIKPQGTSFDGKESTLLKLWSEKAVAFRFKSHKLIIDNFRSDFVITFSPDFAKVTGHVLPIIGRGTTWSKRAVSFSEGHVKENWYIDIYNTELAIYRKQIETHHFTLDVFPWQYNSMKEAIQHINKEVRNLAQLNVPRLYDVKQHQFELTLDKNDYCKLVLGPWLKIRFSEKLSRLLRMSKTFLQPPGVYGVSRIAQFKNRDRQLLLLSNIAKTTAYGQKRLQLLQSFLHESSEDGVIEKHFDPIIFVPLMNNSIDSINIQLTASDYNPINIPDSKTLVCLIFRKVREKSFM